MLDAALPRWSVLHAPIVVHPIAELIGGAVRHGVPDLRTSTDCGAQPGLIQGNYLWEDTSVPSIALNLWLRLETIRLTAQRIPFFVPEIGEAEIAEVVETLRSGWLTTGPRTKQFERDFAAYVGAKHAIAVNSATAALHLALDAIGVTSGDEVIVPTMTFTATAEVVIHRGATPVFVDCEADTLNMDASQLERRITRRTKAIIPVHYGGQPCEMDQILEIARSRGLKVIEDAAHALPARYRGRMIGTIGDVTCFSFYANKTITTGEGGMITTEDSELAEKMSIRSLHGMSKEAWKRFTAEGSWYYEVVYPGYKYNMPDIAGALGLHQLRRADEFRDARRHAAERYAARLADMPQVCALAVRDHVQHSWHLYVVQLALEQLRIDRAQFISELNKAGIGTSVHYLPLHMHPYYRDTFGFQPDDFPAARAAYERIVTLPLYPRMSEDDVDYVVSAIAAIVAEHRR